MTDEQQQSLKERLNNVLAQFDDLTAELSEISKEIEQAEQQENKQ